MTRGPGTPAPLPMPSHPSNSGASWLRTGHVGLFQGPAFVSVFPEPGPHYHHLGYFQTLRGRVLSMRLKLFLCGGADHHSNTVRNMARSQMGSLGCWLRIETSVPAVCVVLLRATPRELRTSFCTTSSVPPRSCWTWCRSTSELT